MRRPDGTETIFCLQLAKRCCFCLLASAGDPSFFSVLGAGGFSLEPLGFLTSASSGLPLSLFWAAVDRRTLECLYEKARVVKYSTK